MLSSRSSGWRAALAAAWVLGAGALAPAFPLRGHRVVANAVGERLRPDPPRRPKPINYDKMAAERKRQRRAQKRLSDAAAGGWDATYSWLRRVELRSALAELDLNARVSAALGVS